MSLAITTGRSVCGADCVYGSLVHIVILGCGRVGSSLAHSLDDLGHSVSIIDMDTKAFRKLSQDFRGQTVTGVGFDRQTLEAAGIERAAAFAAVSSGDNSNILGARVARETYGVASVVARIYDPRRAEIYQRLGIPTVATVAWTSGQILRGLLPMGSLEEYRDPSGTMVLSQIHVHDSWLGTRAVTLEAAAGARIAFITRYGSAFLPNAETVLQEGDLIHALYPTGTDERVTAVFEGGVTA
jgi:trk system potassium uptake protein TrkA